MLFVLEVQPTEGHKECPHVPSQSLVYQTVRWSYPWTAAPIVLQTLSGTAVPRNTGVDMNANG
jgi:hypothetical protein